MAADSVSQGHANMAQPTRYKSRFGIATVLLPHDGLATIEPSVIGFGTAEGVALDIILRP
jgi:hypothetical protein